MQMNTTDPAIPTHDVLDAGVVIRFESYGEIVEAEIIGRNFYFEKFDSYLIGGGRLPIYPHQLRP